MSKFFKRSVAWGVTIATTILTLLPDSIILEKVKLFDKWTDDQNLLIDRIGILIAAFLVSLLLNILFDRFRCKTTIKGNGYSIQVEYGDLFKCKKCQKVIPFDECFTTKIGMAPHEIKAASICGQYLSKNSNLDVQKLIADAGLNPDEENAQVRSLYESAFPKEEQIPWADLMRLMKTMSLDFTVYCEDGNLVGLTIVYPRSQFNWFWYFGFNKIIIVINNDLFVRFKSLN